MTGLSHFIFTLTQSFLLDGFYSFSGLPSVTFVIWFPYSLYVLIFFFSPCPLGLLSLFFKWISLTLQLSERKSCWKRRFFFNLRFQIRQNELKLLLTTNVMFSIAADTGIGTAGADEWGAQDRGYSACLSRAWYSVALSCEWRAALITLFMVGSIEGQGTCVQCAQGAAVRY